MNKINWVSCKDRVPKNGKHCLILTTMNFFKTDENGDIEKHVNYQIDTDYYNADDGWADYITHWCYLADLPLPE